MPSFDDFSLQPTTRTVLANMDITVPTSIQAEATPALLAGKDLIGQSATGSGKTLAYGIPLVERLAKDKRFVQALVLLPTRELATQVNTVLSRLAVSKRLSTALLVGGRSYGPQVSALRYGAQIVVGTPGRIQDHLEQGTLVLNQLRICVLDEADEMLDIGFAPAIEEILTTTPDTRQMALFSATMPEWIIKLQEKFLKDPVKVSITRAGGEQSTIEQIAYQVPNDRKMAALCTLLNEAEGESSLIFGKTKFGVEKLGKQLSNLGFTVGTLHGDKSQRARDEVLNSFRSGRVQTLLATNVAARGLDIKGIHQVINYELPESSELFTHRIGRTGRMGRQGKAITLLSPADMFKWRRMSRSLGQSVSLQRLAIADGDVAAIPFERPQPEIPVIQEREQYDDHQRPARGRKQFAPGQRRDRRAFPRRDGYERVSYERDRQNDTRDTGSSNSPSFPIAEIPVVREREQRPARRDQRVRTEQDSYRASSSDSKRPSRSSTSREAAPRQPRSFAPSEERSYSDRTRENRRGASKPADRTSGRDKAPASEEEIALNRAARRKHLQPQAAQGRVSSSKRAVAGR
ncbi:MAG: DEAD/DEAH box helicase [Ktedonobacteraceae bacterium]|nr:DEAD/DEAH box helicase [Ktedonobacteraceae bacterium]